MDANKPELRTDNLLCITPKEIQQHEAQSSHPDENQRLLDSTAEDFPGQQREHSPRRPDIHFIKFHNLLASSEIDVINISGEGGIIVNASMAYHELAQLTACTTMARLTASTTKPAPLWVRSPNNIRYSRLHDNYFKYFPKERYTTSANTRVEVSKDSIEVPVKASELAEMFLDMNKWADLFPTIVKEAKILKTLDTLDYGGSIYLMYERMHILSPLVAPREFIFLRYCKQASQDTWIIVDESCDFQKEIDAMCPTCSWRFPSGVMIESIPDAKSKVTWVEHVIVDNTLDHSLYKDLLTSSHGYGATRWLTTLRRMSERSQHSVISTSTNTHKLKGGMEIHEGRQNFMNLSLRMIRVFYSSLNFVRGTDLSESSSAKIKMSVRTNNEPGQPCGMIVAASTSIRLPHTLEELFNFLRDESRRAAEWGPKEGGLYIKTAHISTGTHPGNSISIIQPPPTVTTTDRLLQENSIDDLGAFVIFSRVHEKNIKAIEGGKDTSKIALLPEGYLICSDNGSDDGACGGSVVTLVFQLTANGSEEDEIRAADELHTKVTSIIDDLKNFGFNGHSTSKDAC